MNELYVMIVGRDFMPSSHLDLSINDLDEYIKFQKKEFVQTADC